jgi:signal peptidase I
MDVKSYFRKNLSTILMILVLVAFRWSFADQYRVPSGSMLPTIQLGDHVLVNKMAYDFKLPFSDLKILRVAEPVRGEIMVFISPEDQKTNLIKRVIGLPGDHLRIEGNHVFINGRALEEAYVPAAFDQHAGEVLEVTVPDDHYFMMGDNRNISWDSRYWGLVPRENIKGRALGVLWNINFPHFIPVLNLGRVGQSLI